MNSVTLTGTVEEPTDDGFVLAAEQAQVPVRVRIAASLPVCGDRVAVEGALRGRPDRLVVDAASVHIFHMV